MKTITYGQDTIIVGRGATEPTAWAVARRTSAKRMDWHNVYHRLGGKWHKVTCYEGRPQGHVYDAGGHWWSASQTVADRGDKLLAAS